MDMSTHEEQLLKKLAVALAEMPRANTKEIAEAAGISRATFNRLYGSRDNLVKTITDRASESLSSIKTIATEDQNGGSALRRLLDAHLDNQEYLVFLCAIQSDPENQIWNEYLSALDAFFFSGQKRGVFRLDLTAQMITELFVAMICGTIDASRRGRIASSGIRESLISFFLDGVATK